MVFCNWVEPLSDVLDTELYDTYGKVFYFNSQNFDFHYYSTIDAKKLGLRSGKYTIKVTYKGSEVDEGTPYIVGMNPCEVKSTLIVTP